MVSFRIFVPSSPRYEKRQVLHVISIARIMDGKKKDVKNLKKKKHVIYGTQSRTFPSFVKIFGNMASPTLETIETASIRIKRNIYIILSA